MLFIQITGCSNSTIKNDKPATDTEIIKNGNKKLTADYFIPVDQAKMKYSFSSDSPYGEDNYYYYSSWSEEKDVYTNTVEESQGEHFSSYKIDQSGIYLLSLGSSYKQSDYWVQEIADEDSCIEMKFVVPDTIWKSNYQMKKVGVVSSPIDYERETTFVGFENIQVMGKSTEAAHIRYTEKTGTSDIEHDQWYVKGIGLVLSEHKSIIDNENYTSRVSLIAILGEMTDIEAYHEFLDFNYGYKEFDSGRMLDTLLVDIDHDGKKEIITFEGIGNLSHLEDGEACDYALSIYKHLDGTVEKIFEDVCTMQIAYGSRGGGVELLTIEEKDYLYYWYSYRQTTYQSRTLKYLRNNELVTKTDIQLSAKNEMDEMNPDFDIDDNYYTASINGEPVPVEEANALLEKYDSMAVFIYGLTADTPGDYLGEKWK